MEFDITHLDKKLLIQTLFIHAEPKGLGKVEYIVKKERGFNVDGLTDTECELLLLPYDENKVGVTQIIDYHKGKPIKLYFSTNRYGRILTDSSSYDARHGKYRFFEALLNLFNLDEIYITKKGYPEFTFSSSSNSWSRPKEQEQLFKNILKNSIRKEYTLGKYWSIDENKSPYQSSFMI